MWKEGAQLRDISLPIRATQAVENSKRYINAEHRRKPAIYQERIVTGKCNYVGPYDVRTQF